MGLKHNPRVIWPTAPSTPSKAPDLARFIVHLENVPDTPPADLPPQPDHRPLGPAPSGEGLAALYSMSLRTAHHLIDAASPEDQSLLLTAARAVIAFNRDHFTLRTGRHTLKLGPRSLIMGIINVTPDSFSDGGRFLEPDRAIQHARQLADQGADIIDVGGCSTRPGADEVPIDEELNRVMPVIEELARDRDLPISIDSTQPPVVRAALHAGATIVNDITGLHLNPELARLAAEHHAALVVMHIQGSPRTMQKDPTYRDLMSEVCRYLRRSMHIAHQAGLTDQQIVIDPGFGFGKRLEHNLELLARLAQLRSLGVPVLAGTSRKSMIGAVLHRPVTDRLFGTAATVALARAAGALIFRVHDVNEMDQVRRMSDATLTP